MLYVAVTADKYELPIAVADSQKELAHMLGIAPSVVNYKIRHSKNVQMKKKFKVIEVEDRSDDE